MRVGSRKGPLGAGPLPRHESDPAPLEFLGGASVGRMPSHILLAGGPDVDESDLDEIVWWPPEEEETESSEDSEEEDGPGPPL